jgi:allantoate deiminase
VGRIARCGIIAPMSDARSVLERCDLLARCSEEPDRLTRRFATPALEEARALVEGWIRDAGLHTRRDPLGNLFGRRPGSRLSGGRPGGGEGGPGGGERALMLGSHIDTVRDAGRYDGALGVLVALASAERLRETELPFALEIVAFADEEGVRYGTGYLGSSVPAGRFDEAWLGRVDADYTTLADAIRGWGGRPEDIAGGRLNPEELLGYVEVHIEQGPVLDDRDLPVGVVTGIAGQTRARVTFTGRAGHAGTTPMEGRHDALAAAAEWIATVEVFARGHEHSGPAADEHGRGEEHSGAEAEEQRRREERSGPAAEEHGSGGGLVATVGELAVEPGAPNVIPGRVTASLDVRHPEDAARERAVAALRERAVRIAAARGMQMAWDELQSTAAVPCSAELTEVLAAAVTDAGHEAPRLASGAGHDAAMMAAIAPVAMLFVRCAGGVSHHPAESVRPGDVDVAIDVTTRFVERLAADQRAA